MKNLHPDTEDGALFISAEYKKCWKIKPMQRMSEKLQINVCPQDVVVPHF